MRKEVFVLLLTCPAWSVFAGQLKGTITVSPDDMVSSRPADSYFWRLGPTENSEPSFEPPIIVLEKTDSTKPNPTSGTTHTLTIKGFSIEPSFINISPNDKVIFENKDPHPYSCYADGPNAFQFTELKSKETNEQKFLTEDLLKINCHLYPFMKATILITPTALATRADENGGFMFRGLGAGKYQIKAHVNGSWRCKKDIQVLSYGTVNIDLGSPKEHPDPASTKALSIKKQKPVVKKKPVDLKAKLSTPKSSSIKSADTIDKPSVTKPVVTKQKITSTKQPNDRPKPGPENKPKKSKPELTKKKEPKKPPVRRSPPKKKVTEPAFDDIEPEIEIEEE